MIPISDEIPAQEHFISAIVPVFNEEGTVAKLVNTLLCNPSFCEVICINDGSTDRSLEILEEFGDRIKSE